MLWLGVGWATLGDGWVRVKGRIVLCWFRGMVG